jgi:ArsR family transcriptional regulator
MDNAETEREGQTDRQVNPEKGNSCCDYGTLVGVFKALSDASRQKILLLLEEEGEMRVSSLVERLHITQPTISHHLSVLKNARLVEDKRMGQSVYYSVNRGWLTECCGDFMSRFDEDD